MLTNSLRFLFLLKLLMIPISGYGQQFFVLEEINQDEKLLTRAVSTDNISKEEFLISLIRTFSDEGYFQFQVDSLITIDNVHVVYYKKGNRSIIRELILYSNIDSIKTSLQNDYSTSFLESKILGQIKRYQNLGYPFAQSSLPEITSNETDTVDVHVEFIKGPFVEIKGVTFKGNKQLSSSYLQKISGFESPEIYSDAIVSRFSNNLKQNQFLTDVGEVKLISAPDEYLLQYDIVEIRPSFLDIIVGYDPNADGGDQIIGSGRLILNNLLSEGSIASLEFNKLPGTETRLKLDYLQKWVNNWPLNSKIGLDFHQRDSTYYQISGRVDLSYLINRRSAPGIFLKYNTVESIRDNQNLVHFDSKSLRYGLSFTYENLDRFYVPKSGSAFFVELGNKIKSVLNLPVGSLLNSTFTSQFVHFSFQYYLQMSNHVILTPKIEGSASNHVVYFDDDLFRLGGTNSIRGYREDQFRSSNFLWGDIEIRRLVDEFSYLFLFTAIGLEQTPNLLGVLNSGYKSSFLYSGGFGLSYKIPLGSLKLSYALSPEDRFNNGKVHFGISNSF